jgi:hypothetical protein
MRSTLRQADSLRSSGQIQAAVQLCQASLAKSGEGEIAGPWQSFEASQYRERLDRWKGDIAQQLHTHIRELQQIDDCSIDVYLKYQMPNLPEYVQGWVLCSGANVGKSYAECVQVDDGNWRISLRPPDVEGGEPPVFPENLAPSAYLINLLSPAVSGR